MTDQVPIANETTSEPTHPRSSTDAGWESILTQPSSDASRPATEVPGEDDAASPARKSLAHVVGEFAMEGEVEYPRRTATPDADTTGEAESDSESESESDTEDADPDPSESQTLASEGLTAVAQSSAFADATDDPGNSGESWARDESGPQEARAEEKREEDEEDHVEDEWAERLAEAKSVAAERGAPAEEAALMKRAEERAREDSERENKLEELKAHEEAEWENKMAELRAWESSDPSVQASQAAGAAAADPTDGPEQRATDGDSGVESSETPEPASDQDSGEDTESSEGEDSGPSDKLESAATGLWARGEEDGAGAGDEAGEEEDGDEWERRLAAAREPSPTSEAAAPDPAPEEAAPEEAAPAPTAKKTRLTIESEGSVDGGEATVVMPNGTRVEGLSLAEVVELVRQLEG